MVTLNRQKSGFTFSLCALSLIVLLVLISLISPTATAELLLFYKGAGEGDVVDLSNSILAIGDVNNDGTIELVSRKFGEQFLRICCWDGKSIQQLWRSREINLIDDIAVGDADNDGMEELAVIGYIGPIRSLCILKWNGREYEQKCVQLKSRIEQVTIGDVDNDQKNEILLLEVNMRTEGQSLESISIWTWNGSTLAKKSESHGHAWIADFKISDLDGDGKNELLVAEAVKGKKHGNMIFYNSMINVYRYSVGELVKDVNASIEYRNFHTMPYPKIAVRRVNGEKKIILTGGHTIEECSFKNGKISKPIQIERSPSYIRDLATGDIDNDGTDEIIISTFKPEKKLLIYR